MDAYSFFTYLFVLNHGSIGVDEWKTLERERAYFRNKSFTRGYYELLTEERALFTNWPSNIPSIPLKKEPLAQGF